jgi:hypothetical protein
MARVSHRPAGRDPPGGLSACWRIIRGEPEGLRSRSLWFGTRVRVMRGQGEATVPHPWRVGHLGTRESRAFSLSGRLVTTGAALTGVTPATTEVARRSRV